MNRGWKDDFEPTEAIICELKYPVDALTKKPDRSKPPNKFAVVFADKLRRARFVGPEEYSAAPLLPATVTETFERCYDLDYGVKRAEAAVPAARLQLVRRVGLSQVLRRVRLLDGSVSAAPLERPPADIEAPAAEEGLGSAFSLLRPGQRVMVAPLPIPKADQKRTIDEKAGARPTASYFHFEAAVWAGEVSGLGAAASAAEVGKQWAKLPKAAKAPFKQLVSPFEPGWSHCVP